MEIQSCVNYVINVAASIDFNMRIDLALKINYYGPRRLLELSRNSPNLDAFCNVSTCYVNSNQKAGFIEEKIYA